MCIRDREWHLWDHLVQDENPDAQNFGSLSDHPELFDINKGSIGWEPWEPSGDWMHCNTISYNASLDQIVISSRFQNEIYVIDHSTTTEQAAGHTGGNSGKGGDFLYRWGNPQNYDRGGSLDQLLSAQHSVNWIPNEFPGGGNFILYNNGYNKAIEFLPPIDENGNYFINIHNNPLGKAKAYDHFKNFLNYIDPSNINEYLDTVNANEVFLIDKFTCSFFYKYKINFNRYRKQLK